jgi:hypothetical protein
VGDGKWRGWWMRWLMERIVDKMVYEEEVGHEKDGGCDGR